MNPRDACTPNGFQGFPERASGARSRMVMCGSALPDTLRCAQVGTRMGTNLEGATLTDREQHEREAVPEGGYLISAHDAWV